MMEYKAGASIKKSLFVDAKRYDDAQIHRIGSQLLDILDYLHRRSVVHRDISIDNIVDDGARISLLDFGLARPIRYGDEGPQPDYHCFAEILLFLLYSRRKARPWEAAGPWQAAGPWETAGPWQTAGPWEAAEPWQAADPWEAAGPWVAAEPWQAADPWEAAGPWQTADPWEAAEPWQAADPWEAAEPWQAADPWEAAGPWQTADPWEAAEPWQAADPWEAARPAQEQQPWFLELALAPGQKHFLARLMGLERPYKRVSEIQCTFNKMMSKGLPPLL